MAQEVDYASIRDGVIKARHLHAQADLPRSVITQKALAGFHQDLLALRVWDAPDTILPGEGTVEAAEHGASFAWDPNSADASFFVAVRGWRVVGITARVEVAGTDGGAVTAVVKKAASGTDIAAGTALHSGTINLKGTVDTNQSLTLSATSSDLDIPAGTCIGIDFTGTLTLARGCVTVLLARAGSADDLRIVTGTFGSAPTQVQTGDVKALGAVTRRARLFVTLPDTYDAGEDLQIRLNAMMKTTLADTSATVDVEAVKVNTDGTLSADLVSTNAISINSGVNTLASRDFTITPTGLQPGDRLDVRLSVAVNDAAGVSAVIGVIHEVILRCDVRP